MKRVRQLHLYLGVFFAPLIMFFAFTGALQTFGLHESHGDEPPPPAWIATLAEVHKDQRLRKPKAPNRPAKGAEEHADAHDDGHDDALPPASPAEPKPASSLPLKIVVLAMAVALILSSLLGLWIAFQNARQRKGATVALILGTLLPLALLLR